MDISGKHVAILVDNYFEQAEFEEPLNALKEAGAEVTVIAVSQMSLQGMNHAELGDTFEADLLLPQAISDDYDALVLPGGVMNADTLRVSEMAQRWATDFLDAGKPLAAICHAPWLLVSADLVEGQRLTSYHSIRDDIVNAGGEWVDLPVVLDGNLITSRQPSDLSQFSDALIAMLGRQDISTIQSGVNGPAGNGKSGSDTQSREFSTGRNNGANASDHEPASLDDGGQDDPDPEESHPISPVLVVAERDSGD